MLYSGKELVYIFVHVLDFVDAGFKGDGLINWVEEISRQSGI
jgi:hypothetical protein